MSTEETRDFDVRDTLMLFEKRITHMTDLFLQTQTAVQGFNEKMAALDNRINHGISRTMQEVKAQNTEIEKTLIQMRGDIQGMFKDMDKRVSLNEQDFGTRIADYEENKRWARMVVGKVVVAGLLAFGSSFIGMWYYVQQIKERIADIPAIRVINRGAKGG